MALTGLAQQAVKYQLIDAEQAARLQVEANQAGITFYEKAATLPGVPSQSLSLLAAREYGVPLIDIDRAQIEHDALYALPAELIQNEKIVPLSLRGKHLSIAMTNPQRKELLDDIRFRTGLRISPVMAEPDKLRSQLKLMRNQLERGEAGKLSADAINLDDINVDDDEPQAPDDAITMDSDNPIVQYVNKVFHDAVEDGASDIHIEPYEQNARIRFRVDGVLYERDTPPPKLLRNIVSRIKVLAELDIAERRLPQDGRIKIRFSPTHTVDFRVSTLPTVFGEKVVVRILNQDQALLSLDQLGMSREQRKLYQHATQQPHGMVLVTGPTGSGKTVSLYSALDTLNGTDVNISSAEDPVEIYSDGINQVSINEKAGLTFASALRTFLRQDPDILMVGEIRDLETAEIAVKAAQTGHLVLSTLHTNDAAASIVRLLNMGVAPFNIASTLNLVIAQRLVRKLCDYCKTETSLPEERIQEILGKAGFSERQIHKAQIYEPTECRHCVEGYRGRTGVFEVVPISKATSELIMMNANQADINRQLRKEGITTIRQQGLLKVAEGVTSLSEVERVTKE